MEITPKEICSILELNQEVNKGDSPLSEISIDSRMINKGAETIFIALKGSRLQGVNYIINVIESGVYNIVLDSIFPDKKLFPHVNFYFVSNSVHALQEIVRKKRAEFKLPILAITGSNGKTIIKEWLSQLLVQDFLIVKNPKSYNSQIGVPLSIWNLTKEYTLGIFEAGISHVSEMEALQSIIMPDYGILTNIGDAHQLNFQSKKEKLDEKLKLFRNCKKLIVPLALVDEYPESFRFLKAINEDIKIITWGNQNTAKINIEFNPSESTLTVYYENNTYQFSIPNSQTIFIENISICIAFCLVMGINMNSFSEKTSALTSLEMRLEKLEGIYQTTLINDTYNADIDSVKIALEFLKTQRSGKKSIIISEIQNLSPNQIASLLNHIDLDYLIFIGPTYFKQKSQFSQLKNSKNFYFNSTEEFLSNFSHFDLRNQTILIKGSRNFYFETITSFYRNKTHSTYLKVHLNAIKNNLNLYCSKLNSGTKMMVMLKAQGYGLGSVELAKLLENRNVDYFAVAYTDEGVELRKSGIKTPIMVLNPELDAIDKLIEFKLEPEVYSLSMLIKISKIYSISNLQNNPLKIHLKIESGMHRLGILDEEITMIIDLLKSESNIKVVGIFSHLAASDDATLDDFTRSQFLKFEKNYQLIESELGISTIKHILNSGGILRHSQYQLDMVRLGIGLFGYDSTNVLQSELQNTISLISKITQIKKVTSNETIGYGRNGKLTRETKIAIVSIGYADGYARRFGNGRANVWIKGQFFPTIGNICMDMIMIDITDGNQIFEGDEVELMGEHISVNSMAEISQTIPYEIITSISNRVQRIYWED